MKKLVLWSLVCCFAIASALTANAFVRYEDKHPKKRIDIHITGFLDYPPFGFVENPDKAIKGKFSSIFSPMMEQIAQENNLRLFFDLHKSSYQPLIQEVRGGRVDVILGAYHQTELYRGLELIYPAAINNPITVFMLPNRISEVKSTDDLRKLKGVRIAEEVYSDYVNNQLKQFNIEAVETPYKLFEKLFTKEADYVLASHYYGLAQIIKLGLREQVAVARQTLWQIPMFIGISKLSRERKLMASRITRYMEVPENRKVFQDQVTKMISEFEKQYQNVVPPNFVTEDEENETAVLTEEESLANIAEENK